MMPEDITLPRKWFSIFSTKARTRNSSNAPTTDNTMHVHSGMVNSNSNALHTGTFSTQPSTHHNPFVISNSGTGTDTPSSLPSKVPESQSLIVSPSSPVAPPGIIIRESATHGLGAFVSRPFKKGRMGRYAPDVNPITTAEADSLAHDRQDYLIKVLHNNQEVYLNGEDSKDYSVFINHSWNAANVEIDEEGYLYITRNIPDATVEEPVELLMNYGHPYWWDKLLQPLGLGPLNRVQKRWLETVIPDDRLLLSQEEELIFTDWHQRKATPPGLDPTRRNHSPTITINYNTTQHALPTLTTLAQRQPSSESGAKRQCYPTFRRVTINITSFGPLHDPTKGRLSKVLKLIAKLLQNHDIIYIQETHLTSLDQVDILKTYFDGCHIFGSVSDVSPAQAGVIIIVKHSVTKAYDIDSVYSSNTTFGKGRVVSIKFKPKEEHLLTLFSFRETCIYLKSGTGKGDGDVTALEERKQVVQELCALPRDTHLSFLGGDMNQHNNKVLDPFLEVSQMEEVEQDINTFYRMTKGKGSDNKEESLVSSTRIDRWYCNISAAQAANVSPTSRVLSSTIGTVGTYCKGRLDDLLYIPSSGSKNATHITDHVPVGLYLPPPGEGGNASNSTSIPGWVIRHPNFKETIMDSWDSSFDEGQAFTKLTELVSLISKTAARVSKDLSANRQKERQDTWKVALNTLSALHKSADPDSILKATQGDPVVLELISEFVDNGNVVSSSTNLRSYLDEHIKEIHLNSPKIHKENLSRIERLSIAFPKHRERVTSLRDDTREDTNDPSEMAEITKIYWEKHYAFKAKSQAPQPFLEEALYWENHYHHS